jgi:hypothetical protein
VIYGKELHREWAYLARFTICHRFQRRRQPVFFQLCRDESQCQLRSDYWDVISIAQQIRKSTYVILVPMREDDRLHIVETFLDQTEVRKDEIYSRLGILGKQHTAIDDQQSTFVFKDRHVAADLSKTT